MHSNGVQVSKQGCVNYQLATLDLTLYDASAPQNRFYGRPM